MKLRPYLSVAIAVVALTACETAEETLGGPAPEEIAARFVDAWNADDYESMNDLTIPDPEQRERWHSGAMRYHVDRFLRRGQVSDFTVELHEVRERTESDRSPGGYVAEYTITYESEAASEPVEFQGALSLYESDDEWWVEWVPQRLLLPPEEGAPPQRTWEVQYRWGRRGTIRDRSGRVLAAGRDRSRSYPAGSVGGTTVGHLEPSSSGDPGRLVGGSGMEEAFDDRLAGEADRRLVILGGATGREIVRRFGWVAGRDGRSVRTTLDLDVQRAAEGAFGSTVGGAVVLDPNDGDILAAVASSAFDPGNYVGAENVEPFNRALSGLYPPGSSLKVLTASAALDTGEVTPSSTLTGPKEYRGVRNFESGEFGTLTFASALQNSVNTSFAQVALKLGPKRLHRYSERFGFNRSPKMALGAAESSFPLPLDEGDLMWGSIGQAQVLASPLQMATVAATVANEGRRMEPRIDLSVKPRGERAISVKTARTMQELMRSVVTGGTGVAANVSGLDVAGKTGTAEVDVAGERKNHAWFICFAPAANPRVAVAVVAEYGGVGGQVAAPIARSILTSVWPHLR